MADLTNFVDRVTPLSAENFNKYNTAITANEINISTNMANISQNTVNISSNDFDISNLSSNKLARDGSQWMQGDLNMSHNMITNLSTPSLYHHATNKSYVDNIRDNLSSSTLALDGSRAMTGNLGMNYHWISFVRGISMWEDPIAKIIHSDNAYATELYGGNDWPNPAVFVAGKDYTTSNNAIVLYTINEDKDTQIDAVRIQNRAFTPYIYFRGKILPSSNNTYPLGSTDLKWSSIYAVNTHFDNYHRSLNFHLENPDNTTHWLLGNGGSSTLYQFPENTTLTDYRITLLSNGNSRIDVHLNDSSGWSNQSSHTDLAAGGHRITIGLGNKVITTSNGLEINIQNCSNISSVTLVLNYK